MGFGKDGTGVIIVENQSVAFGALGALTAVVVDGPPLTDNFRTLKLNQFLTTTGLTADDGVIVGIAAQNITIAQIAAFFATDGPKFRGDTDDDDTSMHPIFPLHLFIGGDESMKPLDMALRWTWGEDVGGWQWFAFNPASGSLTTGGAMRIIGKSYGVWV